MYVVIWSWALVARTQTDKTVVLLVHVKLMLFLSSLENTEFKKMSSETRSEKSSQKLGFMFRERTVNQIHAGFMHQWFIIHV